MSVSTVEKAFLLLEHLAAAGKPAALNDISTVVGLPKPTTYRLLRSLQNLGYVTRPAGSRDYLIGPRAARLGTSDPAASLKNAVRPLLRRLHVKLNETINLGLLSGTQIHYIDYIETTRPLRYIPTSGEIDPYFCTALGRAIASQLPDDALNQLLNQTVLVRTTMRVPTTREQLRDVILRARELGYAEECEESVEGISCLAVSLAFLGFPDAAISVAVPVQRLTPVHRQEIIDALLALPVPGASAHTK